MIVATDSKAAIDIVRKKGASRRVRHVELRAFFLQDVFRRDNANLVKIGTEANVADMMTKVLGESKHLWPAAGMRHCKA